MIVEIEVGDRMKRLRPWKIQNLAMGSRTNGITWAPVDMLRTEGLLGGI